MKKNRDGQVSFTIERQVLDMFKALYPSGMASYLRKCLYAGVKCPEIFEKMSLIREDLDILGCSVSAATTTKALNYI